MGFLPKGPLFFLNIIMIHPSSVHPFSMVGMLVPVEGGRDYITSQKARTMSGI